MKKAIYLKELNVITLFLSFFLFLNSLLLGLFEEIGPDTRNFVLKLISIKLRPDDDKHNSTKTFKGKNMLFFHF